MKALKGKDYTINMIKQSALVREQNKQQPLL